MRPIEADIRCAPVPLEQSCFRQLRTYPRRNVLGGGVQLRVSWGANHRTCRSKNWLGDRYPGWMPRFRLLAFWWISREAVLLIGG